MSKGADKLLASGWTFAIVPVDIILDKELSDGARTLFIYMHWRTNGDEGLWPSRDAMAEDLGVSLQDIQARLEELRDRGYIAAVPSPEQTVGDNAMEGAL